MLKILKLTIQRKRRKGRKEGRREGAIDRLVGGSGATVVTRSRGGGLGRFLDIIVENQSGRVRVRAWRSRINIYLERERERERGKAESILPASERKKEGKKEGRARWAVDLYPGQPL